MKSPIIIIGVGEMGGVFARGFLKAGYSVIPVRRDDDIAAIATANPDPELVLLAVAEKDLHPSLDTVPDSWRPKLALLQNELLPRDWQQHDLNDPTVISVWFEKKTGREFKVLIPSPTYGPGAGCLVASLGAVGIAARELSSPEQLLDELMLKNIFIVTTNVAGLSVGGNVGQLWRQHRQLATAIANDVMDLQAVLTGVDPDRDKLLEGMVDAFEGDWEHGCMGRSAPVRLARAIEQADAADLSVPALRQIQDTHNA
ncbi:MAG TPA: hypothetical protein EYN73_00215 [Chromatiaceae bacterium]|jgi:hypothetical protein|nr:hypothetical protein [Chromatiaceae bacterium]HIN82189.1 hypothetical protein [Chromatiales bacterium]HIA07522.1 hypothetical protein [Chromatiaceae bacterium]HIB85447.1 hypothetical protein [Chromatiaceae bacterium]HIO14749.1 hypothetical protein [Chromatiales bacterium]